jgi:hypothetical protein
MRLSAPLTHSAKLLRIENSSLRGICPPIVAVSIYPSLGLDFSLAKLYFKNGLDLHQPNIYKLIDKISSSAKLFPVILPELSITN